MPDRLMAKFFVILLVLPFFLAACGGGAVPQTHLAKTQLVIQPPAMAISRTGNSRRDVGRDARRDYKEAMAADCINEGGSSFTCSAYGRGWFVPWTSWPKGIALPETLTRNRKDLIIRAVGIINRSLPPDKRLELYITPESLEGSASYWFDHDSAVSKTILDYIHAEILPLSSSAGVGWTDGLSGVALVSGDLIADPEYAVQTMVHEVLHGPSDPLASHVATDAIEPLEGYSTWPKTHHDGIGSDGRRDYREAMSDDCMENSYSSDCSISGRGWFERWEPWPKIVQPKDRTDLESIAVQRAIMVLNRSLPEDKRFHIGWQWTSEQSTFEGVSRENAHEHADQLLPSGHIHAEIYDYESGEFAGFGGTDGEIGYAFLDESDFDLSKRWHLRSAVDSMVHEFLHAFGLIGHPHAVHTSILSYRYHREGELDNVPLVDVAVLYDMYGWGHWSEEMKRVVDTLDGVQFGVHNLNYGTALIPWVDAGYMTAPPPDALLGSASYEGGLAGYTASGLPANGDTRLSVNFDSGSGSARFDKIQTYNGTTWNMWNHHGFRYNLNLYAHYFDSRADPRDQDGVPDVVGAFYGWDGEVAAGTLQRPEITAAFGANKN